jgi:hypothetical protein
MSCLAQNEREDVLHCFDGRATTYIIDVKNMVKTAHRSAHCEQGQ